jgi:hypothetical protein
MPQDIKLLEDFKSRIRAVLLEENPGGVYIKELKNEDEYDFEIAEIIQLFSRGITEEVFIEKVCKLFFKAFEHTGKMHQYEDIAKKIWDLKN